MATSLIQSRPGILVNLALALALLLAQAGALLHALGHDESPRPSTAQHAQLCGHCLSFSTVLAAAGGGGVPFSLLQAPRLVAPSAVVVSFPLQNPVHGFWSRGPPTSR